MSGVEVLAIISVLAPALKASADYIGKIRERHKKRKDEVALYERELEKSLGEGEFEIREAFHRYLFQFGDAFRRGDDISNQRVETQIIEAESIRRVIKLAWDHKRDVDDIRNRWRSAERIPLETKRTMDELGVRIMLGNSTVPSMGLPAPPPQSQPQLQPQPQHEPATPMSASATLVDTPIQGSSAFKVPFQQEIKPASRRTSDHFYSQQGASLPPIVERPPFVRQPSSQDRSKDLDLPNPNRESIVSVRTTSTTDSRGSGPATPGRSPGTSVSGGFIFSSGPRSRLVGRAERENGFHGFCEGAWKSMRDQKKGMPSVTIPAGLIGTFTIMQCKKCRFRGAPFPDPGKKKAFIIDPRVRRANSGLQYRFSFLVKSHQKCNDMRPFAMEEDINAKMSLQNFGCLFCCAEGWQTATFGGVESLMNHIFYEHSRSIPPELERLATCIWGRQAGPREEFDINIPVIRSPPVPDKIEEPEPFDFSQNADEDLIQLRPLEPEIPSSPRAELADTNDYRHLLMSNFSSGPAELDDNSLQRIWQY